MKNEPESKKNMKNMLQNPIPINNTTFLNKNKKNEQKHHINSYS